MSDVVERTQKTAPADDAWLSLIDTQRHRGDTYKKALDELLNLVESTSISRAQLIERARALYDRALDEAWAKPEARKAGTR